MSSTSLTSYKLPSRLYRRFLMVTASWPGTRAEPGSLLVKIYPGKDNTPLFWAGSPDVLDSFNQQLDGERPIYCMSTTWEVIQPTEFNIKSLALYYVSEILKVQPSGPYLLGGFCEAGAITFEIAKLLTELGHKIDLLAFCEREVTKRDKLINFFRSVYMLQENLDIRLVYFRESPWQCIKEVTYNKILHFKGFFKFLFGLIHKPKKTIKSEKKEEEPLYKLSHHPNKMHLIYVKWGSMGFYRFKFIQKYWNDIALGGTQFYIINGRRHNQPNWNKVAEIVKRLIDDVSLNKAE